ncbi:DNA-binding response regulator [Rhodovulum sulfidophilum]|uniref:Response regulator transcription factor n=1 Tax=Rhodovulum visakhapatnamense TaxID=364297 RepID=A0ABS1RDY2_9RHOB|nr:response regulator transcription factor [Rhodovulum visakhapatnamense]MBL3577848.1 response regulator transcription factor [Rhodovulum visakhapatnamense]OLS42400.1 DNA-binding response regulator [Rhodovulum sulfidophilum]
MSLAQDMPPARQDLKVLIVDDHPVVAEGWGRIVRGRMPCEILCAATALEGWRLWRSERPDLVVVDLTLGEGKTAGLKLIERLRRADRRLPILVFTMHTSAVLARRALNSGAHGIINKDSPPRDICFAFEEVAAGRHHVGAHFARKIALMEVTGGGARVHLTGREEEILGLIAEGLSYREIASRACISYKTVSNVSLILKSKLGASSLGDLVVKAIRYFEGA